jgi:hypothetical protein
MFLLSVNRFEFYLCVCKVFNAQTDDWYRKGLTIRLGKYVYDLGKGWRNWTKEAVK